MQWLYRLIDLLSLATPLFDCHRDGQRYVTRVNSGGRDLLYSAITVNAHRVHFDCRASDSGQCHYALFAHDCMAGDTCTDRPFLQLTVKAGEVQDMDAPSASWHPCVSQHDDTNVSACLRATPAAGAH